jgi:hypothetical protein
MKAITKRFQYFFLSTKGLALVAIALLSLVTAIWGTLSGPLAEMGINDITVRVLGMDLVPAEREGRLIMLYHSIAMTVVAILVYYITDVVQMKKHERATINATVTVGYMFALIFGMLFAYFGHNWIFHGLFIAGQTLMYFGGILLAAALWPWKKEYYIQDPKSEYAHTKGGMDLERAAFFAMAVTTLGSALLGAIAGASFGNGFVTFLAEDTVRDPNKAVLARGVIGHLHIMVALTGVAITLVVGKWYDFKGILHKIAMPSMIFGSIILSLGCALMIPAQYYAHLIIYVGSTFVLVAGLLLVIYGWGRLVRDRLAEQGIEKASFGQKFKALFHDPVKWGATWQMVYMNFCVTFVGLFMAAKLDDIIRRLPLREERITLTGHWHVLAAIIATIMLLYFVDLMGLKGKARKWFGWLVIISSDLAFGAATVFALKRLFVSESDQQPLVDTLDLLTEIGLGLLLIVIAAFLVWRLIDLFKKNGRWAKELSEVDL